MEMTAKKRMSRHLLHCFNHAGFLGLQEIEADTVEQAAYRQMLERHSFLTEDGATPHTWKAERRDNGWVHILVFADANHEIFGGMLRKGDFWFRSKHRIGSPDDCQKCGGTGGNHYSAFLTECWSCGKDGKKGRSSGKAAV